MSGGRLDGARRLACSVAVMATIVLCLPLSRCYGDDLPDILKHMREGMSAIRSAGARITVRVTPSTGYVASLRLEPGQTLLTHRVYDWAIKGAKWRIDEVDTSRNETTTTLFEGRTTLVYTRYGVQDYTRGAFLGTESLACYTPLDHAYCMRGRPSADVLQSDGFRLVRVEQNPTYGRLAVLEGHEYRAPAATTTVWVARERGDQIVRRTTRVTPLGKTISSDRTLAMQRAGGIWLPAKLVRNLYYPGRECTVTITASGIHVNDILDDRFETRFAGRGLLFADGVPLAIQSNGTLGLDSRAARSPLGRWWPRGVVKLAAALLLSVAGWALVLVSVRAMRSRSPS
jgi:hypothetical protein